VSAFDLWFPKQAEQRMLWPSTVRLSEEYFQTLSKAGARKRLGYTRIVGELKRLGLAKICRSTVLNILREAGIDTALKRGEGSW
jgi:hypothetical protein